MTIDDLDLDYEDDFDEDASSQNDSFESNEGSAFSPQNSEENDQDSGESVLEAYLRYSGIKDPTHIEFQDFQGNSITRHWNDLTPEEQLAILTQSQKDPDTDLNSEEIALKMLHKDKKLDEIHEFTNLSIQRIKELANSQDL